VTKYKLRSGLRQQKISVRLERGRVDLGSVMVRASALRAANASFLPLGIFTPDLFARDFFWLRQVLDFLDEKTEANATSSPLPPGVQLVSKVLLFHQ